MTEFRIWAVMIGLSLLTYALRASFIVFLGGRDIPESVRRYLRYVSVAIIPGMIAGLVSFPASMDGQTNMVWLGATLIAILTGLKWKNPLFIMLAGAAAYIILEMLI